MKTLIILLSFSFFFKNTGDNITFPAEQGWKLSTDFPVYTPDNLWDYINGAADGYLSFGFQDLTMAEYTKGKHSIKVEVYRHKDGDNAFGIYATERSPRYDFLDIGAQGYQKGSILNFLAGENYIKIQANTDKSKTVKTMLSIAESLALKLEPEATFPEIIEVFPKEGKVANRESFIAQNFLGHEFFGDVFTASYEMGNERFSLFYSKKSSSSACKMLLEKYYAFAEQEIDGISEGRHLIKDKYNGDIHLVWNEDVVYGVIDCEDEEMADRYLTKLGDRIK